MKKIKIDIPFLVATVILVLGGFLIFSSASLGLLSKQTVKYSNVAFNQTFFGLVLGFIACLFTANLDYKIYKKYSFFIFIGAAILTLMVFLPVIGIEHGGAHRWLSLGFIPTFQPSEFLKIGFIIYLAAWMAKARDKSWTFAHGFLPLLILIIITGAILLKQPDTDTFVITVIAGIAIFLVGGGRWRYIFSLAIIGVIGLGLIAYTRPYVMSRITTFINPSTNLQGSGYQIHQSLIAIGSGGFSGRGFGQSIQKFDYLPEPIGDSIFAVASEEFGFVGSVGIIFLFLFFAVRGLKIASRVPDQFGRLMVVGIVILVVSQAFVNIAAMIGVIPLSGIPLPFISQGGTALSVMLAEAGIILNISKSRKSKV